MPRQMQEKERAKKSVKPKRTFVVRAERPDENIAPMHMNFATREAAWNLVYAWLDGAADGLVMTLFEKRGNRLNALITLTSGRAD